MDIEETKSFIIQELIGTYVTKAAKCGNLQELNTATQKMFQQVSDAILPGSKVTIQQADDDF